MFGELICGPPGSGKTTYCEGKRQFLSVYDPYRPVIILNLDPANESVFPYPCDVDIRDLVSLSAVMEEENLGPNGSYLFCANVISENIFWVLENVEKAIEARLEEVIATTGAGDGVVRAPYLIIDCPGQVEFYIDSNIIHILISKLQKVLQCSLCTVHLIDATIATRDVPTYVSSCVLALTTMIDHELPHINLLTKWDLLDSDTVEEFEPFLAGSNFAEEDLDRIWKKQIRKRRMERLQAEQYIPSHVSSPPKGTGEMVEVDLEKDCGALYHHAKALMEVVEGYGILGYLPLNVQSQEMMLKVTQEIDNAVGNFV